MKLLSMRDIEAVDRGAWLKAAEMGLVVVDERRVPNARRAAEVLAHPFVSPYVSAFPTVSGWSMRDLAKFCGAAQHQQIHKGIKTLEELGLLSIRTDGPRGVPQEVVLTIPQALRDRVAYGHPLEQRPTIALNDQQQDLQAEMARYVTGPATSDPFVVHGYAGTGKTAATVQILQDIFGAEHEDAVLYLAPSGKAAAVLRQRGVQASTIHHALYSPTSDTDHRGQPLFIRKPHGLALDEVRQKQVVVVDEASMVSAATSAWISENATRLIALGDPMQLPPVDGLSTWCGPAIVPAYTLTEEMRFEADTVQRRLGRALREPRWQWPQLEQYINPDAQFDPTEFDAVITWTNDQRWSVVNVSRLSHGRDPREPAVGDVVIFRRNRIHRRRLADHAPYLGPDDAYNGQQSTVLGVLGRETVNNPVTFVYRLREDQRQQFDIWRLWVEDHDTGRKREVLVYERGFAGGADHEESVTHLTKTHQGRPIHAATFGHVLTAHKAQGSGFGRVLVIDASQHQRRTQTDDFARRWLYTAITRASGSVTIARQSQVRGFSRLAA